MGGAGREACGVGREACGVGREVRVGRCGAGGAGREVRGVMGGGEEGRRGGGEEGRRGGGVVGGGVRVCQQWDGLCAGICWHGIMYLMRYAPDANGAIREDEVAVEYHDMVTDDKKEDGFAVLSACEASFNAFSIRHPGRTHAAIVCDGAGCYHGKYTSLAWPYIAKHLPMVVQSLATGEAGKNKSSLDGHFGVARNFVINSVAAGLGTNDVASAAGLAKALRYQGGMEASYVSLFAADRSKQATIKQTALPGVRSLASITYEHTDTVCSQPCAAAAATQTMGRVRSSQRLKLQNGGKGCHKALRA